MQANPPLGTSGFSSTEEKAALLVPRVPACIVITVQKAEHSAWLRAKAPGMAATATIYSVMSHSYPW